MICHLHITGLICQHLLLVQYSLHWSFSFCVFFQFSLLQGIVSYLSHQYSTLNRVRTEMGQYTILAFIQPPRLTRPDHPSMVGKNMYWRWAWPPLRKKQQVVCNSIQLLCDQDRWHTDAVT